MTEAEIIATQEMVGTTPDGDWGPLSTRATEAYLLDLAPDPQPFPAENSREFLKFYGPHGVQGGYTPPMKRIKLPFDLWLYGDKRRPIKTLSPHEKCADSLLCVFERLADRYPDLESRKDAGILCYDGLYAPRLKRGSSTKWSMHSWANAIDLNAGKNGMYTHWPTRATMPLRVMECFVAEGWLPAGAYWSRDAMHFQATLIR